MEIRIGFYLLRYISVIFNEVLGLHINVIANFNVSLHTRFQQVMAGKNKS